MEECQNEAKDANRWTEEGFFERLRNELSIDIREVINEGGRLDEMCRTHPHDCPATDYGNEFRAELERRKLLRGEMPVWMVDYKRRYGVCLKETYLKRSTVRNFTTFVTKEQAEFGCATRSAE